MTKFQKALKSYNAAVKHMVLHVGFKRSDVGDLYEADKYMDGKRNFSRKIGTKRLKFPR